MKKHSNTSHVIVYPGWKSRGSHWITIQIHLMLLFIPDGLISQDGQGIFKYISCYCLSVFSHLSTRKSWIQIHLMLLFIRITGFTADRCLAFKYISCYCLSFFKIPVHRLNYYSNTSHVIVYLFKTKTEPTRVAHSNTSHVIVYREPGAPLPPFAL